jgi:PAS domain S-box-containing protein
MACFDADNRLSKECFETVLQSMAEGLFIIDASGVIRFCNAGLERMSGMPASSIVGKRCRDIMVCACDAMSECGLLKKGTLSNLECRLKRADGTLLPVLKNGRAMVGTDGAIMGGVETMTDISELLLAKRKTAALEEDASREGGRYHLLIGKSPAMRQVFELIEMAAASNANVLLTGESGTGKELAARTIHERSGRRNGPLVKVNCSALPEPLLESELFGHARGAFTGAIKDKVGRFELADGGTLFLDEIGDLSPYIQVKFLRFLQEREFERVGENQTRKADIRIIAATNRNLRELVRSGIFREDLYYRLKVFPVHLPSLRERKEDIGPLIGHFIAKFKGTTGKAIAGLASDAALTMMDYCWPGNIRELENAVEHAFVTCRGKEIGIFDLPLEIRHVELRLTPCPPRRGEMPLTALSGTPGKAGEITADRLLAALARYGGNRGKAALALGMNRSTLWRQMKRLGISRTFQEPAGRPSIQDQYPLPRSRTFNEGEVKEGRRRERGTGAG